MNLHINSDKVLNKIIKIFSALACLCLLLPGCDKEDPFDYDKSNGATGQVNFRKMVVEVNNDVNEVRTAQVNVGEFLVTVTSTNGIAEYAGTYAEMPEILTLPVGDYKVTVKSPSNPDAAWESPYYEGTQSFSVKEDEVTFVEEVVCRIANVKVTVIYDAGLLPYMEDDCKVTVQTGMGGRLEYAKYETRSGNFRYVEGEGSATLVATFTGTVDENYEENLRTYTDVAPGNHYIITYSIKTPDGQEPDMAGTISPSITVEASVEVVDMNVNIDIDDDILADTDRPTQGNRPGEGDDPNPPTPPVEKKAPQITASILGEPAEFDTPITVVDGMKDIIIKVKSEAEGGFTAFTIDIDSDKLSPLLPEVGLATHLDFVNPGVLKQTLENNFGFATEIGGRTEVEYDISDFVPLLGIYGAGDHKFIVTVSDANGTTVRTLYFVTK
ncbi:MAG: DUF4493 domain-containing protein [Prevotella sp.]|nr:DUF4493 domain-containing protein [Prevotella sp.]MCM1074827.1 DUF4493 domain-containing protein [Ruminococcus sp.]